MGLPALEGVASGPQLALLHSEWISTRTCHDLPVGQPLQGAGEVAPEPLQGRLFADPSMALQGRVSLHLLMHIVICSLIR